MNSAIGLTDTASIAGVVAVAIVIVGSILYSLGTIRPIKARAAWLTQPHADGRLGSRVTVDLKSRTRNVQTVKPHGLVQRPSIGKRILHPRWRTGALPLTKLKWAKEDAQPIEGHDSTQLTATLTHTENEAFPPYGKSTRVAIRTPRRRPLLCRMHETHPPQHP